jgi:hypothetical protein
MPMIQVTGSVAANSVNDNVLTGSQFEYLPYNATLEFGLVGSATGMLADAYSGSDLLCEGMAISTANRFPVFPDDYTLTDLAAGGERIKVRMRNTTGGALTYFVAIRITPLT